MHKGSRHQDAERRKMRFRHTYGAVFALNETYTGIAEWLDENGYGIAAPPTKYTSTVRRIPTKGLVTEIYFPVSG
jgi:hypothetical protein